MGRYDTLLPSGIGTSPEDFVDQLEWLVSSGFSVVPLDAMLGELAAGREPGPRQVAITFDDGYADCLRYAMPELAERNLPATFFISSGLLGDRVSQGGAVLDMLAPSDITQMMAMPGLCVGSHGITHANLLSLSPEALAEELSGSRKRLEDLSGRPVRWLSYPYGAFDAAVQAAARAAGYQDALSVWTQKEGPFARLRIPVHTHDGSWRFAAKLSRFYFPIKRWLRR